VPFGVAVELGQHGGDRKSKGRGSTSAAYQRARQDRARLGIGFTVPKILAMASAGRKLA
jgi:hypothetical protein